MSYLVQTKNLTKTIRNTDLVRDVNLHIKQGEIYGFLGPNGAGKTTVMKMLTNLWKPTSGTIELFGERSTPSSYSLLRRMGSIIEYPTFYDHMSGKETLTLHCEYMGYYSPGCVEAALELLQLTESAEKPVRTYSLGMKQRLGIARAVLCKPELLILDEPGNGLDPAGMKQIRDLLKKLSREYGVTVMVSTHLLSEVESIADTIGVIHRGKLKKELAMQEITQRNAAYITLSVGSTKRAAFVLAETLGLQNFKLAEKGGIRIYDAQVSVQEIAKALTLHEVDIQAIGTQSETLEDYFLRLTGEGDGV